MIDKELAQKWIGKSGKSRTYIADKLGITPQSLYNKVTGKTDFTLREAELFCKEVGITKLADKKALFLL